MRRDMLENPCTQCDGDTRIEEPSHFAQGRCDGDIIYRKVECDRCEGTGEEPTPICICGDEATETYAGQPRCAECAEAEKEDAA
jgi:hypothetical protein